MTSGAAPEPGPRRADRGESAASRLRGPEAGGPPAAAPLEPLAPGERPRPLLVAVTVCIALAIAVLLGAATDNHLSSRGGSLPGAVAIAALLVALGTGMYRLRYWAVLSFEALLAFQIIVTSLALIVASTIPAALICVAGIGLGGWLFWKLVRVMGRIQAGERDGA
jgi:hypothetical protein